MKTTENDTDTYRSELKSVDEIYKANDFSMPLRYILGLTNDCNLNCPFCFLDKVSPDDAMSLDDWFAVGEQIPINSRVILFGGEPMYYQHFAEVYSYMAERFRCTIVTNGTLLDAEKIDLLLSKENLLDIVVSIDERGNGNRGFLPEQWDLLVKSLQLFVKRRNETGSNAKLGTAAVLLDETAEGIFEMHKFCKETLRCDYLTYCTLNGTAMQLSDNMRSYECLEKEEDAPIYSHWETIKEQLDKVRDYDRQNGYQSYFRPKLTEFSEEDDCNWLDELNKKQFSPDLYGPCKMPWSDCRIYSNGSVSSCLSYEFGSFKQTPTLMKILTNEKAGLFRKRIQSGSFYKQCNRCVFLYDKKYEIVR